MRFDALRIYQPSRREVFSFPATADQILRITTIPRIRREGQALVGYQRPEVASHIAEIRRYLESEGAVIPNTLVLALDQRARFFEHFNTAGGQFGYLNIPEAKDDEPPPGFLVDGQQRLAAIASSRHAEFHVFVTALIAPDVAEQRKQFVLVNRTKPLPQGLIYELLPEIEGHLPQALARQRLAAQITIGLNLDPYSALYQKIRTPTCPVGTIKDNSVRRMVLNSLSDGALFHLASEGRNGKEPLERMVEFVSTFWEGVAQAFPEAWKLPPTRSRLTHGVGVVAMGYVMDHLYARELREGTWAVPDVAEALEVLQPYCAWTEGVWRLGEGEERHWNEFQNIDRDIRILTNYLRRVLETEGNATYRNGKTTAVMGASH